MAAAHDAHDAHAAHAHDHGHELPFWRKYIFSLDHKVIGIQFLFTSLFFLIIGGLLAGAIRYQLAYPNAKFPILGDLLWADNAGKMTPSDYVMIVTMHASVMIFFVIIPMLTGAFGNYLIPLQIGYKDMAFPTLNMLSYWFMVPAVICIVMSFLSAGGTAAAGWTAYPPLSVIQQASPGSLEGQKWWYMSLLFVGVSSMMGSVNYMTTIINCRAKGMTMFRMPMATWAMFITAILQAFALPVLTVALIFGLLDNLGWTSFFVPANLDGNWIVNSHRRAATGGQPLLWQHLFWFYSHPAVYIMILPAMGMVSDIIATHARKPIFGYKPMVYSVAGIAGLGFIVWGHHMFMSGMAPGLGTAFMVSTMLIALPSAIKVFNWIFTVWGGNVQFTSAMLNALSFVAMFIIGGLSGIYMASTPTDIHFHDTYFIVAHIHYVLFGGSLFGFFAAVYHWFPKMFGRMMNERWGKIHFFFTFIFFNLAFYTMHNIGIMGAPRRYMNLQPLVTPEQAPVMQTMNLLISHSVFALMAIQVIFFVNIFYSLFFGPKADANPWRSNSLEWQTASPPPHHNFVTPPVVYHGPYEYGHPDLPEDHLNQTDPREIRDIGHH
ncbi:MAG TPA: cbb3-type cytochrome c oxidase subunit I [Gemmatales bacterium]|nr:cbb3-type cytochrome c oxidase subunit I [Gemmatales bacterium]